MTKELAYTGGRWNDSYRLYWTCIVQKVFQSKDLLGEVEGKNWDQWTKEKKI